MPGRTTANSPHRNHGEFRTALPGEPTSAALARRFVASHLADAGLTELCDTATLLVSELVSNAVLHAHTDLLLVTRIGRDRVTVEVHDGSTGSPTPKNYSSMSGTGRGLVLVEALSDSWGSEETHGGKYVWFDLSLPQARPA